MDRVVGDRVGVAKWGTKGEEGITSSGEGMLRDANQFGIEGEDVG